MRVRSIRGFATVVLAGALGWTNGAQDSTAASAAASAAAGVASEAPAGASARPQFRIRAVDPGWAASLPRDMRWREAMGTPRGAGTQR